MARLPLEGIRVTDFSWILNGPSIGLWLATMGAEVIKIESTVYPDIFRRIPVGGADNIQGFNRNGYYHYLNYSKKAVNINLATPRGRELAYDLVRASDFVLECFTTPHTRRLGLTYEELKAVKPDIIVISISLLGRTGSCADWVGWGPQACAFVGQVDALGYPGPDTKPRQTGGTWPDYEVGTAIIFMALAALRHRKKTGQGQHIDSAMTEIVAGEIPEWFMEYFMNGRERGRWANDDDIMAPHNTYRCKGDDKWVAIAVGNDDEGRALCRVMGNPGWTQDPKFADQFRRGQNAEELDGHLTAWTKNYEYRELAATLQKAGVPAGPVLYSPDIIEDPHLWARGFWWEMNHHLPEVGKRVLPGIPIKLSNVPAYNYSTPPDVGQHNEEVFLGLLGLPREEYERLKEEKVIY